MKDALIPFRKRSMRSSREQEIDPFARLSRELDGLMNTYYGRLQHQEPVMDWDFGVELYETDREVRVRAELPGMNKKDIQISLDEDVLTIRAVREERQEKHKRNYHISEVHYGGVSRSIRLPVQVDCENATVKFKRGVLTLRLPKSHQLNADRKRISVSAE